MTKKAISSQKEVVENMETMRATIKIISKIIVDAKYMEDEPNDNSPYLHALSIQSMGLINLIFMLLDKKLDDGVEAVIARAMFLRSLVEANANIHYFAAHKDDDVLAKRFLKTADVAEEALRNIRDKKTFKRYYWCEESISKRISNMEEDKKSLAYSDLYFYLSSFVHSDAGFLTTLPKAKSKYYPHLFFAMTVVCMMDIMDALEKAGALQGSSKKFLLKLKEYLDSKPKTSNVA